MSTAKPYYKSIAKLLKSVKRPGTYAAGGLVDMPLPGLSIAGKFLGLPLGESEAKRIIDIATRAPYGKGEETVVDISVRRTWQLDPSQFSIVNEEWLDSLESLVTKVAYELGCSADKHVSCQLYKLLLYEPGGFFKRHRDIEKANGMFGTLVIQLPSDYIGGQLTVFHQNGKKEFDFSGLKGSTHFYYAAFYADCQHEIHPVSDGYRLCLIYNLVYSGEGRTPTYRDNKKYVNKFVTLMRGWNQDVTSPDCPRMMAYMLEHHYCDESCTFQSLKNVDQAVVDILIDARQDIDFDLYLTSINITQSWSVEYKGWDWWDRSDYSIDELLEEKVDIDHLLLPCGKRAGTNCIIKKKYFIPKNFFDTIEPSNEEYEAYTGNAGGSVEKWYKWAAIIIWPKQMYFHNVGVNHAVQEVCTNICEYPADEQLIHSRNLLTSIISFLNSKIDPPCDTDLLYDVISSCLILKCEKDLLTFLEVLLDKLDRYLFENCLFPALLKLYNNSLTESYAFDVNTVKSYLNFVFKRCPSQNVDQCCLFLQTLSTVQCDHSFLKECAGIISNTLSSEHCNAKEHGKYFVCNIVKVFVALQFDAELSVVVNTFLDHSKCYPVYDTLVPAVFELNDSVDIKQIAPIKKLGVGCVSLLEASICPPLKPENLSQIITFTCTCVDCNNLKSFVEDPTSIEHKFKMNKKRRLHIQNVVSKHSFTCKTERVNTLVVTKDCMYQKYQIATQEYNEKLEALKRLQNTIEPTEHPIKRRRID